jgi:hypothetical protein
MKTRVFREDRAGKPEAENIEHLVPHRTLSSGVLRNHDRRRRGETWALGGRYLGRINLGHCRSPYQPLWSRRAPSVVAYSGPSQSAVATHAFAVIREIRRRQRPKCSTRRQSSTRIRDISEWKRMSASLSRRSDTFTSSGRFDDVGAKRETISQDHDEARTGNDYRGSLDDCGPHRWRGCRRNQRSNQRGTRDGHSRVQPVGRTIFATRLG